MLLLLLLLLLMIPAELLLTPDVEEVNDGEGEDKKFGEGEDKKFGKADEEIVLLTLISKVPMGAWLTESRDCRE